MSTSEVDIHKNVTVRRPLLFMANDVETLFVRWRHEVLGDLIKLHISRRVPDKRKYRLAEGFGAG